MKEKVYKILYWYGVAPTFAQGKRYIKEGLIKINYEQVRAIDEEFDINEITNIHKGTNTHLVILRFIDKEDTNEK